MTTTTADHLLAIARMWPDLRDALSTPTVIGGFGIGIRQFLASVVEQDVERAEYDGYQRAHLRSLERSTAQLGERPVPLNLRVFQAMHDITLALVDTADAIAETVQRPPIAPPSPRRAAHARTRDERRVWADHALRVQAAQDDAADVRRWKWAGTRPDAPYTALWLLGRVQGAPGPFRRLSDLQEHRVGVVAASAVHRIETVLDTADDQYEEIARPCACGGRIEIIGGAGAQPVARCRGCGALWSETTGIIAS